MDYHLQWIKNIKPQNYKINVAGLYDYCRNPSFNEPVRFAQANFDNFDAYSDEFKGVVIKLQRWNGKGAIALLSNYTGIGKTHLAIATARNYFKNRLYDWINTNKDTDFGYKDYAQADFNEYRERNTPLYFSENDLFRNDFGNIEFNFWLKINRVVVIDDLFAGKQTELSRSAVYELINTRVTNHNLPTIITSNLTLEQISRIDERIASRLQGGMTFELKSNKDFRAI